MKNTLPLCCLFLLSGCAINTTVVRSGRNGTSIIYGKSPFYAMPDTAGPSIFPPSIDLLAYLERVRGKSGGVVNYFLTNDEIYIEAKVSPSSLDSTLFTTTGLTVRKPSGDSLFFRLSYRIGNSELIPDDKTPGGYKLFISFLGQDTLLDGSHKSYPSQMYAIEKSQQFEIQKNVLDLLTGEARHGDNKPFRYLVVNDVDGYWLDHVVFLTMLTPERMANFSEACNKRFHANDKCPNGYEARNYYEPPYFLVYNIYCECKR